MLVSATLRNAQVSPQKCRLVADLIRGKSVEKALSTLEFTNKKSAVLVKKLLDSAIANAENNEGADIDDLYVKTIYVNQAPTLKRIRARAKGRANRIIKRSSHITIFVSDEE